MSNNKFRFESHPTNPTAIVLVQPDHWTTLLNESAGFNCHYISLIIRDLFIQVFDGSGVGDMISNELVQLTDCTLATFNSMLAATLHQRCAVSGFASIDDELIHLIHSDASILSSAAVREFISACKGPTWTLRYQPSLRVRLGADDE